jgi:tight adherence protein B
VSRSALLAGIAGACAVACVWEALVALDDAGLQARIRRLLLPLRSAAREGRQPSARERRRLALVGAATLMAGGGLIAGPLAAAAAGCAGPWAVHRLLAARRGRWRREVVADAPLVARAVSDALAAGESIRSAIGRAADSGALSAPGAAELRACAGALAVGEPTDVALERLAARVGHAAYDTMVAGVLLHRDAGGDLARLLRELALAFEDARRVEADARSATTQARFTAWLVAAMPVGVAALVGLADPGALRAMLSSTLPASLCGAALVLALGALVAVRRLARLEDRP